MRTHERQWRRDGRNWLIASAVLTIPAHIFYLCGWWLPGALVAVGVGAALTTSLFCFYIAWLYGEFK